MRKRFKNTWIKLLFSTLPPLWFSLLGVIADWVPLFRTEDRYSGVALFISISMIFMTFSCAILLFLGDRHAEEVIQFKDAVLAELSKNLKDIDIFWQNLNLNYLLTGSWDSLLAFNSYINYAASKLLQTISIATGVTDSKIVATYFYRFKNQNWTAIDSNCEYKAISWSDLQNLPGSVFLQIFESKAFIIHPSKEKSIEAKKYVKDTRDLFQETIKKPLGSIMGTYTCISIPRDSSSDEYEAVIVISSYGKYLCAENDYDTIRLLSEVLNSFAQKFQNAAYWVLMSKEK